MGNITAVTSGKGGAGKTMFAANLACTLAKTGMRVLLVDMNTGTRNLDLCLGMESQIIFDLSDVVMGICPVNRAIVKDRRFQDLYLLSASQNRDKAEIGTPQMKKILAEINEDYDHIIIDTPAGFGNDWKASVAGADRGVILLTPEFVSLRDADTVNSMLRSQGVHRRFAVVNHMRSNYGDSGVFPTLAEISESLRTQLAGVIQEDENVHISMNRGIPVVCKADTYVGRNFEKICSRIFGEEQV